ncbi:phosphatase PAP2 family protein [Flavobacterium oreochromis]|uniref:Phosphatase PAP2 family protein n=2 Tax=Flavobacterium TaxID=237 RepID=A0A246GAR8_9FLAO|nr:phosphatase PAP2 family protein [Flavobacterium oreochromis]OWP77206.1 phosphatase PAP2 family protein [Flavobacterium oreochromis]OWP77477.1 phosphatase PAP2 family protein [Flavobacterium oreochromis]POR27539.1 phosphatase PAP2 family protein [Flavobacterium columnare]
MLEYLIELDKQLFIFLNGLGTQSFDGFWLFITKQFHWTPFFIIILYLVYKKEGGWKPFLVVLFTITLLITFTDQFTNLVKEAVQRLRPCSTPELKGIIRIVKSSDTFSFFSGHAANSMATTVFVYLILRRNYKYTYLLFFFPLIFAYSRIYLGLHYPSDILTGYIVGGIFGVSFYVLYTKLVKRKEQ